MKIELNDNAREAVANIFDGFNVLTACAAFGIVGLIGLFLAHDILSDRAYIEAGYTRGMLPGSNHTHWVKTEPNVNFNFPVQQKGGVE